MGKGAQPYGTGPYGSEFAEGNEITVVKRIPQPNEIDVDPDIVISFSVRSSEAQILTMSVFLDNVLFITEAGLEPGVVGTIIPNAFNGFDVSFEHDDFPYNTLHSIRVLAEDAVGNDADELWQFGVRDICFGEVRFATPPKMRNKDPDTERWLKVWDGVYCFVRQRTVDRFLNQGMFDIDKLDNDQLRIAFADVGLTFPEFDEIDVPRKRRILRNANAVHASRYTAVGLEFYISLLVDADVQVVNLQNGNFILWNSELFGFPTPAQMDTSLSEADICNYLVGEKPLDIKIIITGFVPENIKQFLIETIDWHQILEFRIPEE